MTVEITYRDTTLTTLAIDGVETPIREARVRSQIVAVAGFPPEEGPWELTVLHDGDIASGEYSLTGEGPTGTWSGRGRVFTTESVSIGPDRFRRTVIQRL